MTSSIPESTLPSDHPAKLVEDALRLLTPHLAASLHAWVTRPPRPPLAIRAIQRLANRFTRTGRALRAFANAYVDAPELVVPVPMPTAAASPHAHGPSRANGVTYPSPPAADRSAS